MAVSKKKVRVHTQEVNDYGFVVLTAGINFERFKANPVMLFGHNPEKLLGEWMNIEISGTEILMTPNFNSKNEFAAGKEQEFEDGFLKGATLGLRAPYKWETGDKYGFASDVMVLAESTLYEVSLYPLQSNANAVALASEKGQLYTPDEIKAIQLSAMNAELQNQTDMNFKNLLITTLGLAANATDADIETALKNLKGEHVALTAKKAEWETLEADKKELAASKIEIELNAAVAAGKITEDQKPVWKGQLESNFTGTKTLLDSLVAKTPAAEPPAKQPVNLQAHINNQQPVINQQANVELKTVQDYLDKGMYAELEKMKKDDKPAYIKLCAASGIEEKTITW